MFLNIVQDIGVFFCLLIAVGKKAKPQAKLLLSQKTYNRDFCCTPKPYPYCFKA